MQKRDDLTVLKPDKWTGWVAIRRAWIGRRRLYLKKHEGRWDIYTFDGERKILIAPGLRWRWLAVRFAVGLLLRGALEGVE